MCPERAAWVSQGQNRTPSRGCPPFPGDPTAKEGRGPMLHSVLGPPLRLHSLQSPGHTGSASGLLSESRTQTAVSAPPNGHRPSLLQSQAV